MACELVASVKRKLRAELAEMYRKQGHLWKRGQSSLSDSDFHEMLSRYINTEEATFLQLKTLFKEKWYLEIKIKLRNPVNGEDDVFKLVIREGRRKKGKKGRSSPKKTENVCTAIPCKHPKGNKWVGCDGCGEWIHQQCTGLSKEDREALKWESSYFCKPCDGNKIVITGPEGKKVDYTRLSPQAKKKARKAARTKYNKWRKRMQVEEVAC